MLKRKKMLIDGHDLDNITDEINRVLSKYKLEIKDCSGAFDSPTVITLKIEEKKEAKNE